MPLMLEAAEPGFYISLDTVAKVFSILSLAAGLIAIFVTAIKRKAKEEDKIKALEASFIKEQEETKEVRRSCHEEQTLIIFGLLACLNGLAELGCDGPVAEAIKKIEKHINIKAHDK